MHSLAHTDCGHWYGTPDQDGDVPHWLPYLEPEVTGDDPSRKITLPLPDAIGNAERRAA